MLTKNISTPRDHLFSDALETMTQFNLFQLMYSHFFYLNVPLLSISRKLTHLREKDQVKHFRNPMNENLLVDEIHRWPNYESVVIMYKYNQKQTFAGACSMRHRERCVHMYV